MELSLQKQTITVNETVTSETVEQAIECDAMLPDYCPDIVKILKCSISTFIGSTQSSGQRLAIEGIAHIRVYYQSENEGIRRCEYKVPFAKTMDLQRAVNFPIITVSTSVDYVNCRAVSPRRIDVRGAVSLAVKVSERRDEHIISHAQGAGIQLRQHMVKSTELCGQSESMFAVEEELELAYGKPSAASVLRTDCRVNVHECKIVSGRVIAKADFTLHVTYLPQSGGSTIDTIQSTFPLSQIIDADGVDENSICDVLMHVVACDVQPREDESGENRRFTVDARIKAVVVAHRHQEIAVASDCYSTQFECKSKQHPVSFLYLERILREVLSHRDSALELPEGVAEAMDVWGEIESANWKYSGGELIISVRLLTSMFARMAQDNSVMYFEQMEELEQRIAVPTPPGSTIQFEPSCDIISFSHSSAGQERLDIRCDISIRGRVYCLFTHPSVSDIEIDETAPRQKENGKLYLYFAEKDDSIWDIAKRYNTSANAVWEENGIESDILPERRMLLIPIV